MFSRNQGKGIRRTVSLVVCGFECMVFAGLILAWVPLLYTFMEDGIYQDRCDYQNVTAGNGSELVADCSEQTSLLNLGFTLGIASSGLSAVPFGILLDRFGLRISRIFASVCSFLGILSWAFASKGLPWLVIVGCILNGVVLQALNTSNYHAAGQAGSRATTVITLYTGCVNVSPLCYSLVMILNNNGFHRRWSLILVAGLWIVGTFNTIFLLPKYKVNSSDYDTSRAVNEGKKSLETSMAPLCDGRVVASEAPLCVGRYVWNRLYVSHALWFCLLNIRINVYSGTILPQLIQYYSHDHHKVSHIISIFGYMSPICVVAAFPIGILGDHLKSVFTERGDDIAVKARHGGYTLLLPCGLHILLSAVNLVRADWAVYGSFLLYQCAATALFSYAAAFISSVYPAQHFGKLFGFLIFIGQIAQLVQIPLLKYAERTSFQDMLLVMLGVSVASLFHPLAIMCQSRLHSRQQRTKHLTQKINCRPE